MVIHGARLLLLLLYCCCCSRHGASSLRELLYNRSNPTDYRVLQQRSKHTRKHAFWLVNPPNIGFWLVNTDTFFSGNTVTRSICMGVPSPPLIQQICRPTTYNSLLGVFVPTVEAAAVLVHHGWTRAEVVFFFHFSTETTGVHSPLSRRSRVFTYNSDEPNIYRGRKIENTIRFVCTKYNVT